MNAKEKKKFKAIWKKNFHDKVGLIELSDDEAVVLLDYGFSSDRSNAEEFGCPKDEEALLVHFIAFADCPATFTVKKDIQVVFPSVFMNVPIYYLRGEIAKPYKKNV